MNTRVKKYFEIVGIVRLGLIIFLCFFATWIMISPRAYAEMTNDDLAKNKVYDLIWHGFISQGYIKSTANNYLGNSKDGSFNFTEVALNVTKIYKEKIDLGAQLFARKFGPAENFDAKFDWFYANYQYSDWLKFKVGRIKIPYGLYNELSDIDSARVPILLPQSVYPSQNRNYLLAQNGVQLYGFGEVAKYGSLGYHFYAGSINLDLPPITSTALIITQIDVPHLLGGRLLWETPLEGLISAFTLQELTLKLNATQPGTSFKADLPVTQRLISLEYTIRRLKLATEYGRQYVELKTNSASFPYTKTTSEQFYFLANYQLTDDFAPGIYYSMLTPNVSKRGGREKQQSDLAIYFRYDLNSTWLVKLGGHLMNGTGGLNSSLNDNMPLSSLEKNWGVFMVKTTANF